MPLVRMRSRELGIRIGDLEPGPFNAITDVAGVGVGHRTLISGDGPLVVGQGPVRTGVTVVLPHDRDVWTEPVFAGSHRLNGNGEMTGLEWIREAGMLASPIGITNTHSVGVVRDALVDTEVAGRSPTDTFWGLPVVAETWDGRLNDINGMHVRREHVSEALAAVSRGPVELGSVGGGTGMVAFGFKGGIGSSSRVVDIRGRRYVVGVLVQANYGKRDRFRVDGVPIGRALTASEVPLPGFPTGSPAQAPVAPPAEGAGSVIVIVATDAPLVPHQCQRLAQRAGLAIGRTGGAGETSSGDLFLAFATGNRDLRAPDLGADVAVTVPLEMLSETNCDPLFWAAIDATEEAVLDSMLCSDTMTGRDGVTAHRLDPDRLLHLLRTYRWGAAAPR